MIAAFRVLLASCCWLFPGFQETERQALQIQRTSGDSVQEPINISRRWAFLVGVDRYNHLRDLEYCTADMRTLRDALIEYGGYDPECVVTLTYNDQSKLSISAGLVRMELMNFLDKVGANDSVLLAFSGHGDVDEKGKAWLMMPEVQLRAGKEPSELFRFTAIAVGEVYDQIASCEARQKLVVLDACRSGASRGEEDERRLSLNDISPGKGILELLSCDADQVSFESKELGQGVFSHFLCKGIAGVADEEGNRDGFVTADELYNYAFAQTKGFVLERHGKEQTPKRRSNATGQIVVARNGMRKELTSDDILSKLAQLERTDQLPNGFGIEAKEWLNCDPTYPPGITLRKLLSLLAEGTINKDDFDSLSILPLKQVQGHIASSTRFSDGKTYVVCIGIDEYQNLPRLANCQSDARFISDVVRRYGRAATDATLLLNQDATGARIRAEIEKTLVGANKNDLVIVYYSGHAMGDRFRPPLSIKPNDLARYRDEIGEKLALNAWLPTDAGPVYEQEDLRMAFNANSLLELIQKSEADVLVISDSSFFDLPLPRVFEHDLPFPVEIASDRAVVFLGLENCFEIESGNSQLSLLLAHCLTGFGDIGVSFDGPRFLPSLEERRERAELKDRPLVKPILEQVAQSGDGFVSLQELVAFVEKYQKSDVEFFGGEFRVRGHLPKDERIVTRVNIDLEN